MFFKNHGICSGFCFSPRKNTVNNSNFAGFSCFSLFFELRWSAIHGYQILRVLFPTISTFGCFWSQWPTSLAVTSGCPTMRCGRLPSRSDVNIEVRDGVQTSRWPHSCVTGTMGPGKIQTSEVSMMFYSQPSTICVCMCMRTHVYM